MSPDPTQPARHRNSPPPHGDRRRYKYWRCKCIACREANRIYQKRLREGRSVPGFVDPTGTARRIQGLAAYGYTLNELAGRLGVADSWLHQLARPERSKGVLRRTAQQIEALYDELTALPPPTGRSAAHARTAAARNGWVSPWAWDDDRINDPAAAPVGVGQAAREQRARLGMP